MVTLHYQPGMSESEDPLREALETSTRSVWRTLGGIAVVGTVVTFFFFVFNVFGLNTTERILASLVLVLFFLILGMAYAVAFLYVRLQEAGYSAAELDIFSTAFEILNRDDGVAWDDTHIYESQERVLDLTGENVSLSIRFTGQVSRGTTSDGILIKYIGDDDIVGDSIDYEYIVHDLPLGDGETEPQSIEVYKEVDTYSTILKLPFGTTLEGGEQFDVELDCEDMGEAPLQQPIVRMHFPLFRFKRVDEFRGVVKIDSGYTLDYAARVQVARDFSQFRDVQADDIELERLHLDPDLRRTHTEYTFREQNANKLYVARFKRE